MSRQLILWAVLLGLALMNTTRAADPSLVGWWRLDEPGGTVATDASGQGNDASLGGSATFTSGLYGRGVYCDGAEAYVEIPGILTQTGTVAFWFKPDWDGTDSSDYRLFDASAGDKYFFISKGAVHNTMTAAYFGFFFEDAADTDFQNVTITAAGAFTANTWYHVAATWQFGGGAGILYLDGVEIARGTNLGAFPTLASNPRFGYTTGGGGVSATYGARAVFDDIKVFDRGLTAEEIPDLMEGAAANLASAPSPEDKATDVLRDMALSWAPGIYGAAHDVYFGTDFDDVNNASRTSPQGVLVSQGQEDTTYDPAGLFDFGQTYYWRVDEFNAPPTNSTFFKGRTWSFTAEPYSYPITMPIQATASSSTNILTGPEKTIDGSGLNDLNQHSTATSQMWLSKKNVSPIWIQYKFDRPYKLHQMWVWNQNQLSEPDYGLGAYEVTVETSTDGTTWTALEGVPEFAQAPGEDTYVHNTTVDFGGITAQFVKLNILSNFGGLKQAGLSEVRFFYVPVKAYGPTPDSGTAGVAVDEVLNWRAGRTAASHEVYLGTDPNALSKAGTVTDHHYDLSSAGVEYDRTYYWKVNEVNSPDAWEGDVWSFSTPGFVVVDDFESYDDNCKRIFYTWADGYGVGAPECGGAPVAGNGSGSTVGNASAPYAEQTNVYSGSQAIPIFYDNTTGSGISEAVRTFSPAQDWTFGGLKTLVLFFKGDFANEAGQVYVKINGTKVSYSGNANALTTDLWNQWNVDLSSLSVKAVITLTIGVSGTGKGVLYVDDIRLYRSAPAGATEQLYIEAESATPTVPAPWTITDEPQVSGGKYITTSSDTTSSLTNPPTTGVLTYNFTVAGGAYKLWFRIGPLLGYDNDSLWVRIKDASIDPTGNADNPGWVRFNGLAGQTGAATWHWGQVWDDEHGSVQVTYTLPAGSHTLEVGYREPAVPLDAILITNN